MMKGFARLMLARVEGWVVALLVVLGVVGAIGFGAVVKATALGSEKFGLLGDVALAAASLPGETRRVLRLLIEGQGDDLALDEARFAGAQGFAFAQGQPAARGDGYLVLSRYDGDRRRSIVELVDLATGTVLHRWQPDFDAVNARSALSSALTDLRRDNAPDRARILHPLIEPDGSLVYNNLSPLVKIDACSRIQWTLDRLAHHSIEPAPDGGYWVALHVEPQTLKGVSRTFVEDSIAHVSADGTILWERSLAQLLIKNGLARMIFGQDFYSDDPLHLNDIQPALADGRLWRRGDLFLSLRNTSAILLYRPSEDKVLWLREEPWVNQHDVDILDDHRIAVFNNNRFNTRLSAHVEGSNDVMIHDFTTGKVTSPWRGALRALDVRSVSEGRSEVLADGGVFIEETNSGRILRLDRDGAVLWSYVNRAGDGALYRLNWSRILPRARGDAIRDAVARARCGQDA